MPYLEDFLAATNSIYEECEGGITKLDRIIVGVPDTLAGSARLALVPAAYAYWERFFRVTVGECYRIINAEKILLSALSEPLACGWLRNSYAQVYSNNKISRLAELPSRIGALPSTSTISLLSAAHSVPVSFDAGVFVETESNVTYKVVESNLQRLGVASHLLAGKESRRGTLHQLLKTLVDARNQIAHGERIGSLSPDEWTEIKESALFAMNALQLTLHEHLESKGHLRQENVSASVVAAPT
jgi:hypothetical protein